MQQEIDPRLKDSPFYSPDLAPVPASGRTWTRWSLAALWVGMAVCIPTYMLAVGMIANGIQWWVALLIIGLANIIITLPMVLNGHAGVKYGVPFPVLGRAAFGTQGIHIPALIRAFVACGWFGIQTWIGGLAIYAMWHALMGTEPSKELDFGQFVAFAVFWLINAFFIWKGTESIKVLENLSAPILILMGVLLIVWGAWKADGFGVVLDQSKQLERPALTLAETDGAFEIKINAIETKSGQVKAKEFQLEYETARGNAVSEWLSLSPQNPTVHRFAPGAFGAGKDGSQTVHVTLRNEKFSSTKVAVSSQASAAQPGIGDLIWQYLIWLTVMVGFWATMSISIADITRYARTQSDQTWGQFIGLPGTMILFSFIGIFVTCASIINFDDILIGTDAPWNPVDLLGRFDDPVVVIVAQLFMLIATLTTNIAANIIAPANAFANLMPRYLNFRSGGIVASLVGVVMCPWWIMDEITPILLFVSGWLGPVLGILLSDYFLVRRSKLDVSALFDPAGAYAYKAGFNVKAFIALVLGIFMAMVGSFVPALDFLYNISWFTGFATSLLAYYALMRKSV